ncbi:hypothetical protein ACFL2V_19615 [Pseudomonadota bacterium]
MTPAFLAHALVGPANLAVEGVVEAIKCTKPEPAIPVTVLAKPNV